VSDTRIDHPDITQIDEIPGRIKAIIIRSDLCVAFAGKADSAIDAIRNVARRSGSHDETAAILAGESGVDADAPDFMVASIAPHRLSVVSHGYVREASDEDWIGDPEAASRFSFYKTLAPSFGDDPDAVFGAAQRAFRRVVDDVRVTTVGGIAINVMSGREGFVYLGSASVHYPPQTLQSGGGALSFGTAAHGGLAYSVMTSEVPGTAVLAVFMPQGQLGYVYAPLEWDRAVLIKGVSQIQFAASIRQQFGITIRGPGIDY
jgi:hypothetical protein